MSAGVRFLRDLFEFGQVALPVGRHAEAFDGRSPAAEQILRDREQVVRLSWPGTAPDFKVEPALEGASWLFLGGQLVVERARRVDAFASLVDEGVARWSCDPETVYAIDLVMRFLPDLCGHAARQSEEDVLMKALLRLAGAWPLSSVGVSVKEGVPWDRIAPWWGDFGLRQQYVDRVIACDDATRVEEHPLVKAHVKECLGGQADVLAGESVAAVLHCP